MLSPPKSTCASASAGSSTPAGFLCVVTYETSKAICSSTRSSHSCRTFCHITEPNLSFRLAPGDADRALCRPARRSVRIHVRNSPSSETFVRLVFGYHPKDIPPGISSPCSTSAGANKDSRNVHKLNHSSPAPQGPEAYQQRGLVGFAAWR